MQVLLLSSILLSTLYSTVHGSNGLSFSSSVLSASWELEDDDKCLTLPTARLMFTANIINGQFYTFGGLDISNGAIAPIGTFEKDFQPFGNIDTNIYTDGWFVGQNEGMIWSKDSSGIYLACEDTVSTAKIARFEYTTGTLQTVAILPEEFRSDDCCAVLYQDSIFIFGGLTADGVELDTVLIYDLEEDSFSQGANLLYPRSDHTCVYSGYDDQNLVSIWGRSTDDDITKEKYGSAQFYDLDENVWTQYPWQVGNSPKQKERLFKVRAALYPRGIWIPGTQFILYTGGNLGIDLVDPDDPKRFLNDIYVWSLERNKFVLGDLFPKFVESRSGHSLVATFEKKGNVGKSGPKKIDACLYAIGGINSFDANGARGRGLTATTEKLCFTYRTRF